MHALQALPRLTRQGVRLHDANCGLADADLSSGQGEQGVRGLLGWLHRREAGLAGLAASGSLRVQSAAAAGVPFAESGDDVYAYGSSASELVVYRLKYLGPPQG